MNKKILLFLFLLPFNSIAEKPSKDMLVGQALDNYGKIAGAWYLNKYCSFLSVPKVKLFEENVASITVALNQDIGNPQILFKIQKSSKTVAESKKYAGCKKTSEEIVIWGVNYAKVWNIEIQKIKSSK